MPTTNVFGPGCVNELGESVKTIGGKKPLIVAGVSKHGHDLAEDIANILKKSDINSVIFAKSEPNPTDTTVHEGVEVYKNEACDCIISVGGGSPMDAAKGIGVVVTNGGKINDYEGLDKSTKPMPPMIAVNTTAGTASEMTRFTIITDTERHIKMAIVDWRVTPNVSFNDPELMVSMSPSLTAATGMDALTHAIEAYVSTGATPLTDCAALKAVELVVRHLPHAVENGDDIEARDKMVYAEFLAGMAFNNASLGLVHAMAHQLGGFYNLPHGVCNAVLLPHVESFNLPEASDKFATLAQVLGADISDMTFHDAGERAIKAISELAASIGIPTGLKELGVKEEDLPTLAENALNDACYLTNPRKADRREVIQIYKNAM